MDPPFPDDRLKSGNRWIWGLPNRQEDRGRLAQRPRRVRLISEAEDELGERRPTLSSLGSAGITWAESEATAIPLARLERLGYARIRDAKVGRIADPNFLDKAHAGMTTSSPEDEGFPSPLSGESGGLRPRLLPATALSLLSAMTLAAVPFLFQLTPEMRLLLRFWLPAWALFLMATALAWTVTWSCRRRPALLWPKRWALALALFSTLGAAASFWLDSPFVRALSLGALVSSLALLPRLFRIRPDDPLLRWIPLVTLLAIILVVALIWLLTISGLAG